MKSILFFTLMFLLPLGIQSQPKFDSKSIPVKDGQVIFQVDIEDLKLNSEQIKNTIVAYFEETDNPLSNSIAHKNETQLVFRVVDYIEYSKGTFHLNAMYMRYNLIFEYKNNSCIMTLRNLNFVEKEEYEKAVDKNRNNGRLVVYSAKEIMIDKAYKNIFIKNTSDRITTSAIERINKMTSSVEKALKNK